MSGTDGRGGPPVTPQAVNLTSFNTILFMLEKNLVVEKGQYVRERIFTFSTTSNDESSSIFQVLSILRQIVPPSLELLPSPLSIL